MSIYQKIKNIVKYTLLSILILLLFIVAISITPALYNRWIVYPGLERARNELWNKYQQPDQIIPLESYRGVLHSHTYWSHDSRGTLHEILDGAKQAELQFMFLSDHKRDQLDTFPRGYHGIYDGIIIESGTEHSSGLMISPFDSLVVAWSAPEAEIIQRIAENDGLVTYVHSEDEHDWDNPYYHAMEIYNIHTDVKDEDGILPMVINGTFNRSEHIHWGFREIYDEQTEILSNWDRLNQKRRVVGIAGVDAHNNQNFRARWLENGQVEWVGPNADELIVRDPNWFDKLLLGEPDKYGWAFKWELDPYFNSYNFSNNYVFADTLTNVNIRDHIKEGHVFISFEHLASGAGFQYYALDNTDSLSGILGDSVELSEVEVLRALSPYPVKFQLIKDGKMVDESEQSYEYQFPLNGDVGNYRIVARVMLKENWIPWVYTNPIYVY